ncbi:hypothetical protein [Humidisolicoccus flavus]|uniref:hypothetical protein n=1 Tax=Humidisolicoccus flavus TaxID=3111414 RepID=UPI00324849DF
MFEFGQYDEFAVLRFADPEGRQDSAGRLIPHEFVLIKGDYPHFTSLNQARDFIWPQVLDEYALVWNSDVAPG